MTLLAARRLRQERNRVEAAKARYDTRAWALTRRARTRELIELGALVQKAGLADVTGGDRTLLYRALIDLAERLGNDQSGDLAARCRPHGARGFADEAAAAPAAEDEEAKTAHALPPHRSFETGKGGTGGG